MKSSFAICLIASSMLAVSGCKPLQGKDTYNESEIGKSRAIEYGTIRSAEEIAVNGNRSGAGTLIGAGVGAGGGSYVGNGSGNAWATAGAALAGAVAGTLAEEAMSSRTAIRYVVAMQNGTTKTITQEKEGDVLGKGQKVMLEYCDGGSDYIQKCKNDVMSRGSYQRLLPVDTIPPYVKKKRRSVK